MSDPADRVTLDESITIAFLVVLDALTPAERVAFVLHDVFGYAFAQVAEITGRTPAACRQLATSARRRVRNAQSPATPPARASAVVREFMQAWRAGNVTALVDLLEPDASAITDGGGTVSAAPRPIEGAQRVASYYVDLARKASDVTIAERSINGRPGLVALRADGAVVTVFAFDLVGDRIKHIWAIRNPDKLRHWTET